MCKSTSVLFARKGNLEWLKPTADSTPTMLRDWRTQFDKVYYSRCFGWSEFLDNNHMHIKVPITLIARRHCKAKVKFDPPIRHPSSILPR